MNNNKHLQNFITQTTSDTFVSNLSDLIYSLEGESLNDMVALLLAEILSPGLQNLKNDHTTCWLTPTSIQDAVKIGTDIAKSLTEVSKDKINWNRVFNLMSTKYFLGVSVKPTTASLSSIFASLNFGPLIDEFFNCDWDISIKLEIAYILHKWSVKDGCFNLLEVDGAKHILDSMPNTKQSLLYLTSIANLNLEIFLLRDELATNPTLPYYQESFFKDFNSVPEYLAFALCFERKRFILLTENKSAIDELLITLVLQVFEKSPMILGNLVKALPDDDIMVETIKLIIQKENISIANFIKVIADEGKLDNFINKLPFSEAFKILPSARKVGWSEFQTYISKNLNSNSISIVLENLELQCKMTDANTPYRSSKVFDIPALHHLITILMSFPMNPTDHERFSAIQLSVIIIFPRIINFGYGHDQTILSNGDLAPIPADVEKEMQSYLQKMYSSELAIKDIIDLLRRLRDSENSRDQDLFACMAHAVLAESTFFKDYPLEALATTSVLFGSMILFQLLRGFVLDVAFRVILNFAKEGPESKMFKFSVQAVYAFKMRLVDYPQYCKDLLEQVPGLQSQPQVYQSVAEAAALADIHTVDSQDNYRPQAEFIVMRYFVVDELKTQIIQENPPKEVVEKILFIVNNMTEENFDDKISDLKSFLAPQFSSWFAQYLVNQRAKTEANYHTLYSKIIVFIDSRLLHEYMINVTLKQLLILLSNKDISSVDKNVLKSLSSWLGKITLGMGKPIKHNNIAFRELLLDAYKQNRLELVVPFVCKVLMNSGNSKIFSAPNPWTIGIIKLLIELNQKANWKLSLTFEVEVLCKSLGLILRDIEASSFIEAEDSIEELSGTLNNVTLEQRQLEQQRQMILMQQYQQHMVLSQPRQGNIQLHGPVLQTEQGPLQSDNNLSNDNPFNNLVGSSVFVSHPDLRRVFQMAISKSVREILPSAVEKSASIAVITTCKIISKDFATEVDDMKLKAAAITMVRQLAQSLARATSIEPLKEDIRNSTKSLAPNLMTIISSPLVELQKAIDENLGLALSYIEKAAMDKAMQDLGEQLMQEIAVRRYHKERRSDQPFLNQNANPYAINLPEPLGLKSSGVTQQQFRIYETFGKFVPNVDNSPAITGTQGNSPQQQIPIPQQLQQNIPQNYAVGVQPPVVQHIQNQQLPSNIQNDLEQNHRVLVQLMDNLVLQIKENSNKKVLKDLSKQNPIKQIILQILTFIAKSTQRDQLALKVAQAVVNSLFATSESSLCREVLSIFLEQLCSLSALARKDVTWWLIYAPDSRKFNIAVVNSLLNVNLINGSDLDNMLSIAIDSKIDNVIDFAIQLIQETVLSEDPTLMKMDFIKTLRRFSYIESNNVRCFLAQCESIKIIPVTRGTKVSETEKYYLIFTEWVKLLQQVETGDEIVLVFVKQLIEKGVLSHTGNIISLIKASLELSIFSFKESDPTGEVFVSIDSLAKLIIKLIVVQDFNEYSRREFFNTIFCVIMLVFTKDHEQETSTFNERPYFRLLSNILYEWSNIRGHNFINVTDSDTRQELIEFDSDFYNIFASYLHSLQPIAFSGFSFAFITLMSHRMFLPVILRLSNKSGWEKLTVLIIDLFKFLNQYTDKDGVSNAISVVYKGTLRVILGISNDLPEYLIENHYELINHLQPSYSQLKNVILSAVPKKMLLPNPYDFNIDMGSIELCQVNPIVFYDPVIDLHSFKKPVDNYLRIPSNSLMRTIINGVYKNEYTMKNGIGYDYVSIDIKLVRAIVLHIGIEAGIENEKTSSSAIFNVKSSYYTLLFNLSNEGTAELKHQVIEAIVEQLRYPNIHTYWFCFVLKNMFVSEEWGEQKSEIQEIILRNILERIIVNKPHTWGVTVFFTQLLHFKDIDLLELPFIKNVPEISNIIKILKAETTGTLKIEIDKPSVQQPIESL